MEQKIEGGHLGAFGSQERPAGRMYPRSIVPDVYLRADVKERQARLAEIIFEEIVPRLRLIHDGNGKSGLAKTFSAEEIAEFGALAMGKESVPAFASFERMRERGHSLETLFVNLLAPTARYLGELWEQDRCDFVDVTLGVARLQELLHVFGSTPERPMVDMHHRALLVAIPGEQHLFGVEMVARFMRGAGWEVVVEKGLAPGRTAAAVATEWFGVVGVTLSGQSGLETVASLIQNVRRASANREIGVMVGGPAFAADPELVARVGADVAASDAPTAVLLAKKLLLSQAA